jgi:DNA-binding NtrC family response regulator
MAQPLHEWGYNPYWIRMRVLVVDDDRSIRRTLEKLLLGEGYEVTTAEDSKGALDRIAGVDCVLLDLGLPGRDGFAVLETIQGQEQPPHVIVVTAREDMQSTVRAVQLGAFEYLVKPVDVDLVRLVVKRAIESRVASRTLRHLVSQDEESHRAGHVIGKSAAMREVYKSIGAVSLTRASVLLVGESGTGKELVARAVHYASADRDKPFVAVNCTAFASTLIESELFGHARGAFTGAIAERAGRFELAGSGTLFLDEIAEIPLELQAKLLRVLQERTFERVGDPRPIPLDARVIAATHGDLAAMVQRGSFREDLLYRLRVVEIRLPPLRERREDIPLLALGLLAKINRDLHRNVRAFTPEAMMLLERYPWPGNVRELENALMRAVVHAKGDTVEASLLALDGNVVGPSAPPASGAAELLPLREVEKRHIERVLRHTDWNKRRACAVLDISRPTLDRKIEEYGLSKGE